MAWERAYLGNTPLLTTSVFWLCIGAVFYTLSYTYLVAVHLHSRDPQLFARVGFGLAIPIIAVVYWLSKFIRKAATIRSLLRGSKGGTEYLEHLQAAKSLTMAFFYRTMGLGIVMSLILLAIGS